MTGSPWRSRSVQRVDQRRDPAPNFEYEPARADAGRVRRGGGRRPRRGLRAPPAAPRRPAGDQPGLAARRVRADHRGRVLHRSSTDGSPGHVAAVGAVAVDRPTLFIQGTILVLAFVSVLLIADTSNSPFAAQAAAPPGSPEEREGLVAGTMHTEIFPLTLFAVGGMLLFPAANDLLTMFVALEVLSLPLYLLCGLARRRRLLSHEAAMKYFLLGAFSSAFFLFGIAMLYGFSGSVSLSAIASAAASNTSNADPAVRRDRADRDRAAVQDRGGAVPGLETRRVPGRADADHRADGVLHGGVGLRRAAARLLRRVRQPDLGLAPGDVGDRGPDHGRGRGHRHHPDRREAAAGLLLDRACRVRADRGHRGQHGGAVQQPVLPGHLRADHGRCVRGHHPGAGHGRRGRPPVPLGGPGPALAGGGGYLRAVPAGLRRASR